MSKNIEIESKILLSQKLYQQIITSFTPKNQFEQSNYYFDNQQQTLKKDAISLRIRLYHDHAEQTLKVNPSHKKQNNFQEVIEINDDLTLAEAKYLVNQAQQIMTTGQIANYLQQNYNATLISTLKPQTWSQTNRTLLDGPYHCELTLDKTCYPDGYSDYEMEIENPDPATVQKVLDQLKEQFNLTYDDDQINQSKIKRAYLHKK